MGPEIRCAESEPMVMIANLCCGKNTGNGFRVSPCSSLIVSAEKTRNAPDSMFGAQEVLNEYLLPGMV